MDKKISMAEYRLTHVMFCLNKILDKGHEDMYALGEMFEDDVGSTEDIVKNLCSINHQSVKNIRYLLSSIDDLILNDREEYLNGED